MTERIGPAPPRAISPLDGHGRPESGNPAGAANGFQSLLEEAQAKGLSFSKHAVERMERRNIALSTNDLSLLMQGIDRAEQKGSRESLLLMDNNTAFVVNVPSRTVITAVDEEGMKEKTFTNIDSAILLNRG